jgi:hypothetical protein
VLRILFNTIALGSLLFGLATSALWIRSYWRYDQYGVRPNSSAFTLYSNRGGLSVSLTEPSGRSTGGWVTGDAKTAPSYGILAFRFRWREMTIDAYAGYMMYLTYYHSYFAFPHWAVVILSSLRPAFWFYKKRRHTSRIAGRLCLRCGYDLRASTVRCPECGTAFEVQNPPA